MAKVAHPHVAMAEGYARAVVAGKVLACSYVRQACARHLGDLKRSKKKACPYRFDPARAERVCHFATTMPHTKGKWAARRLGDPGSNLMRLEPWQAFIVCAIFGWIRKDTGKRRFRVSYVEVPRKNGKSMLAAIVGLYMLAADGEYGAEVYSGATTERQAWEVFRPARLMALQNEDFREYFGVDVGAKNLAIVGNGSRFEPVIGKPGDGSSPSCAIIDELHEHETDDQVDTMHTGMGAREQPLLFGVTTSGTNFAGPCYSMRGEVLQVLAGDVENDELFGIVYTVDEATDWTTEDALRMANPNFDVSVSGDFLRSMQRDAIRNPRRQNTFKTKHLDVWAGARTAWMNMEWWRRQDDAPPIEEWEDEPCWMTLDLANKLDLTSRLTGFRREVDGVDHLYVYDRSYLPEDAAEDPARPHYHGWAHGGHLVVTDGNILDYDRVREDLLDDAERHPVMGTGYDPYSATQLALELQKLGITIIEIPQTVAQLSDAMKWTEALVKDGRLHHTGSPVLTWAVSNVVAREDAKGNIFPRKDRPDNKIDPAVALIMLVKMMMAGEALPESIYEQHSAEEWAGTAAGVAGDEKVATGPSTRDQSAAEATAGPPRRSKSIYEQFAPEEWGR